MYASRTYARVVARINVHRDLTRSATRRDQRCRSKIAAASGIWPRPSRRLILAAFSTEHRSHRGHARLPALERCYRYFYWRCHEISGSGSITPRHAMVESHDRELALIERKNRLYCGCLRFRCLVSRRRFRSSSAHRIGRTLDPGRPARRILREQEIATARTACAATVAIAAARRRRGRRPQSPSVCATRAPVSKGARRDRRRQCPGRSTSSVAARIKIGVSSTNAVARCRVERHRPRP